MNVYLWIVAAVVISMFYLGSFIYFFSSDIKKLGSIGGSKVSLIADVLLLLLFILCIVLAIYIYMIIQQQLVLYGF